MTLLEIRRDIESRSRWSWAGTCRYVERSAPSTSAICGSFDYGHPRCRSCGSSACAKHYDKATERTEHAETESGSVQYVTVYCDNCRDDYGPEED